MDIANAEAFVETTLKRCRVPFSPQEREELLAEGLTILYELAAKYKPLPQRPGIDSEPGRFSGYAAMFLPRRLGDAWHKSHPEHRYVTGEDGKRGWVYGKPAVSLDGLSARAEDEGGNLDRLLVHARTITDFCHATRMRVATAVI